MTPGKRMLVTEVAGLAVLGSLSMNVGMAEQYRSIQRLRPSSAMRIGEP